MIDTLRLFNYVIYQNMQFTKRISISQVYDLNENKRKKYNLNAYRKTLDEDGERTG